MKRFTKITITISTVFLLCLLIFSPLVSASNPNEKSTDAISIKIAYTCNTWGQLQPCPA